MRLLKKKVNVFGKGIPVFAIVILSLALVSATLLSYFGVITGSVIVSQGLLVDGKQMPASEGIVYGPIEMYSLEAETVSSGEHYLGNTADVDAEVKFVTTCSATGGSDGCDDVTTTPIFEISIIGAEYEGKGYSTWDRVVTKSSGTVSDIESLSFDYMLITSESGYSPYFVLELDTDDNEVKDTWAVSWQDTVVKNDEWFTHGENLLFHITGSEVCTQQNPCSLATVKEQVGSANILAIKVAIGEWSDYNPTTASVKNIEVNGANAIDNGIVVPANSGSSVEGDVDFSIESYFLQMMKPAEYTITTEVKPVTA